MQQFYYQFKQAHLLLNPQKCSIFLQGERNTCSGKAPRVSPGHYLTSLFLPRTNPPSFSRYQRATLRHRKDNILGWARLRWGEVRLEYLLVGFPVSCLVPLKSFVHLLPEAYPQQSTSAADLGIYFSHYHPSALYGLQGPL